MKMSINTIAPEIDALRMGMHWDEEDIQRGQILVESTFGDSHPGSVALDKLAIMASDGIKYAAYKPSNYTTTDMCDGIAQGHEGMNYSLVSREFIAGMVEIHAKASNFDGMVLISSCDKAIPAHLMSMARINIPSIFVPGGVMSTGSAGFTLEQIGSANAKYKKGNITESEFKIFQSDACPTCGACQFMGTAATMQIMSEALGLALPHSAVMPATSKNIANMAKNAGKSVINLIEKNINPRDIINEKSLHNAIVIHGAIGGSTNALLHLPAIAYEAGIKFDVDMVDKLHREIPFLVNTRPVGAYSTDLFWYAGGVPQIMLMLKDKLYLDVMTVTGKTLGENLKDIEKSGKLEIAEGYLKNYKLKRSDIIKTIYDHGAIAILKGNIAEKGAVVKYVAMDKKMHNFTGKARVFNKELDAREAILSKDIKPGDVIIISYAGPKGSGMPEMFYTTEALCDDPILVSSTAIITDGRFSGASKGPCIGHVSPEAAEGGNIGLIRDGDLIEIDIPNRTLTALNVNFEERRKEKQFIPQKSTGILGIYKKLAVCAIDGGYMK
jgi:dihydroxy-acid dehydratase